MKSKKIDTEKQVGIAIFSALAFVVAFVCNVIPPVAGFLSLDVKDAVIAIASFIYGPVAAVIISLIAALIELITFSTTGWYGFVMNFVSSAVFSLTAALIYNRRRNINGALISFFAAVISTTSVMLLLNIFVTPIYLTSPYVGMPAEVARTQVMEMLPKILLPFNFAKALLNSAVAMLLYKPLSRALKKAKYALVARRPMDKSVDDGVSTVPQSTAADPVAFNKNTAIILSVGFAALAVAVVILLVIS